MRYRRTRKLLLAACQAFGALSGALYRAAGWSGVLSTAFFHAWMAELGADANPGAGASAGGQRPGSVLGVVEGSAASGGAAGGCASPAPSRPGSPP